MRPHRFGKLLSWKSQEGGVGNLFLRDEDIGKIFLLEKARFDGGLWKAKGHGGTCGREGVNWELLHD